MSRKLEIKQGSYMEWYPEARIMYEEFTGKWAREDAIKFVEAHWTIYKEDIEKAGTWAEISDIRDYEISDINAVIAEMKMPWAMANGLKHVAIISNKSTVKIQLKEMAKESKKIGLVQKLFETPEEAIKWLDSLGYKLKK